MIGCGRVAAATGTDSVKRGEGWDGYTGRAFTVAWGQLITGPLRPADSGATGECAEPLFEHAFTTTPGGLTIRDFLVVKATSPLTRA